MTTALDPTFARAYQRTHGKRLQVSGEQRSRKRSGDEAEAFVEQLHEACLARGVAFVRKLPTPFRIVGSRGGGKLACVPEKKSGVDYVGHMLDGSGRAVFAEVKRCTERRFAISRVEEHQRAELDRAHDAGAVAVLVVVYGPALIGAEVFAMPWRDVRDVLARGDKSLAPEDLVPHLVRRGEAYLERWVRP